MKNMFSPLKRKLREKRIILATQSIQRKELFNSTGLKFETIPSDYEEDLDKSRYSFSDYVQETALRKVQSVYERLKDDERHPDIIIGMDTMVACDGIFYGKPKDPEEAAQFIRKLANSGLPHMVYTGVVIKHNNKYERFVETTTVYMRSLSEEDIMSYVETGEPMGKAGAYAIQGLGGSFVRGILGDFNNVIGLPLCSITQRLTKMFESE
ncbi:PREDICTED: septum formation protein Maf [Nicrophorus vespilloides]|uniref:Septum formation protein Maf n=1 Tax=Nicrophorus vespilloides TaxID=110193 RepID=A0ABM1M576_NICVS|nr:PREDICTED: septum formation protein Maf [Nicrophorus vespilloides]